MCLVASYTCYCIERGQLRSFHLRGIQQLDAEACAQLT